MRSYLQAGTVLQELGDLSPFMMGQVRIQIENDVAALGSPTCRACGQPVKIHAFFVQKNVNVVSYGPDYGQYQGFVCKTCNVTTGY